MEDWMEDDKWHDKYNPSILIKIQSKNFLG